MHTMSCAHQRSGARVRRRPLRALLCRSDRRKGNSGADAVLNPLDWVRFCGGGLTGTMRRMRSLSLRSELSADPPVSTMPSSLHWPGTGPEVTRQPRGSDAAQDKAAVAHERRSCGSPTRSTVLAQPLPGQRVRASRGYAGGGAAPRVACLLQARDDGGEERLERQDKRVLHLRQHLATVRQRQQFASEQRAAEEHSGSCSRSNVPQAAACLARGAPHGTLQPGRASAGPDQCHPMKSHARARAATHHARWDIVRDPPHIRARQTHARTHRRGEVTVPLGEWMVPAAGSPPVTRQPPAARGTRSRTSADQPQLRLPSGPRAHRRRAAPTRRPEPPATL